MLDEIWGRVTVGGGRGCGLSTFLCTQCLPSIWAGMWGAAEDTPPPVVFYTRTPKVFRAMILDFTTKFLVILYFKEDLQEFLYTSVVQGS